MADEKQFLDKDGLEHIIDTQIGKTDISGIGNGTIKGAISTVKDSLGTLTDLATTEKTNIVGAVNEVKNSIPVVPTLATVATSGSYNDLSDKPTIPSAQVQSDWNATTGVSAIKNKPSILSQSIISDAWDSTKTYAVNDYCIYNNSLWKCKVSNKNSTPVEGSNWTATSVGSELKNSNGIQTTVVTGTMPANGAIDIELVLPSGWTIDNCAPIFGKINSIYNVIYNIIGAPMCIFTRSDGKFYLVTQDDAVASQPFSITFMKYQ